MVIVKCSVCTNDKPVLVSDYSKGIPTHRFYCKECKTSGPECFNADEAGSHWNNLNNNQSLTIVPKAKEDVKRRSLARGCNKYQEITRYFIAINSYNSSNNTSIAAYRDPEGAYLLVSDVKQACKICKEKG